MWCILCDKKNKCRGPHHPSTVCNHRYRSLPHLNNYEFKVSELLDCSVHNIYGIRNMGSERSSRHDVYKILYLYLSNNNNNNNSIICIRDNPARRMLAAVVYRLKNEIYHGRRHPENRIPQLMTSDLPKKLDERARARLTRRWRRLTCTRACEYACMCVCLCVYLLKVNMCVCVYESIMQ